MNECYQVILSAGQRWFLTMCLPEYDNTLSAVFVIKNYIQDHPEQQNLETPVLARAALVSKYPCK